MISSNIPALLAAVTATLTLRENDLDYTACRASVARAEALGRGHPDYLDACSSAADLFASARQNSRPDIPDFEKILGAMGLDLDSPLQMAQGLAIAA